MAGRAQRASLLHDLAGTNPWWLDSGWEARDPQLRAAAAAPFDWRPDTLNDLAPPNLYTLRGPRRVGKTTVVKQTIARLLESGIDRRRICFFAADALADYRDLINLFQTARLLFPDLADQPRFFFVDEITAVAEWQRGVKWLRDNTALSDDCVVVTGSSARDVSGGASFLAGRRGPDVELDRLLLPMSFPEFARCAGFGLPESPHLSLATLYTLEGRRACQEALPWVGRLVDAFEIYLEIGGFPQAVTDYRTAARVSDGFVRDVWNVIQADLHRLGVSRPEMVLRLMASISARLASTATMRGLADEVGVTHPTAASWIDALANAYTAIVLFQEAGGVPNPRAQRKIYPVDPTIALLASRLAPTAAAPELSQLAESALAVTLFRAVEGNAVDRLARPSHLFFYRSPARGEIDFVVEPGRLGAESKYVDATGTGDARTLVARFGGGLLLSRGAVDFGERLTVMPAGLFAWVLDQRVAQSGTRASKSAT